MILRPLEGRTGTGPIDNLAMYETQLECPECGAFEVWHIPEQQGTCHGGKFTNSCIEVHCRIGSSESAPDQRAGA